MIEIADLRECEKSGLFYGGRAGQKEGILIDGEPWIAKYPRTTRDLRGKHLLPTPQVRFRSTLDRRCMRRLAFLRTKRGLATVRGRSCARCRDFTYPDKRLSIQRDQERSIG